MVAGLRTRLARASILRADGRHRRSTSGTRQRRARERPGPPGRHATPPACARTSSPPTARGAACVRIAIIAAARLAPATVIAAEKQRGPVPRRRPHVAVRPTRPRARARSAPAPPIARRTRSWPVARTAPVVIEPARARLQALPGVPGRMGGQVLLGALMVVAFVAVILRAELVAGTGVRAIPPASDPARRSSSDAPAHAHARAPTPVAAPRPRRRLPRRRPSPARRSTA